jgi:hypothetical protein
MRWSHTTACGNDGKTKLISAGQSGAIELFTGPKSQRMNRLRNQIGELINPQLFGNDLRRQFSNSLD